MSIFSIFRTNQPITYWSISPECGMAWTSFSMSSSEVYLAKMHIEKDSILKNYPLLPIELVFSSSVTIDLLTSSFQNSLWLKSKSAGTSEDSPLNTWSLKSGIIASQETTKCFPCFMAPTSPLLRNSHASGMVFLPKLTFINSLLNSQSLAVVL